MSFKDANLVLNESLLMKFKQGRQKSSLSSFSNLFRYELLKNMVVGGLILTVFVWKT